MLSRLSKVRLVLAVVAVCMLLNVGLVLAEEVTVKGTVNAKGDSFVLQAQDGEYVLQGDKVADFVGKAVEVKGTVAEKEGQKIIQVTEIKEAK